MPQLASARPVRQSARLHSLLGVLGCLILTAYLDNHEATVDKSPAGNPTWKVLVQPLSRMRTRARRECAPNRFP